MSEILKPTDGTNTNTKRAEYLDVLSAMHMPAVEGVKENAGAEWRKRIEARREEERRKAEEIARETGADVDTVIEEMKRKKLESELSEMVVPSLGEQSESFKEQLESTGKEEGARESREADARRLIESAFNAENNEVKPTPEKI